MSFDNKDYPNRKDKRTICHKSGKFDRTCRPNGSCPYCLDNRLHSARIREQKAKDKEE